DERGRTAMTEDAERWVRFANLGLRMLTSPSSSPRAKAAFMCALPNPAGRRVWSGHSGARFSPSFTPVNIVNGVNIAGNTRLRRTAGLVNTVNVGMLEGREAPLPPAGLQPEDSGRPLILPAAYGEAGERDNAPGDRAAGGRRVEGEHPRAARWAAGRRVDRAGHRRARRLGAGL